MVFVLFREHYFVGRHMPINSQIGIIPSHCTFGLRRIEIVTFILKHCLFAQHRKAMGKTLGYEKLPMALGCQPHRNIVAIGGRITTDVNRHIKHLTTHHSYKFALRVRWELEMQPSHYAIARF